MGLFGAPHGWGGRGGGVKRATIMKLGTVIPYLKKIQKMCESLDTTLEFC